MAGVPAAAFKQLLESGEHSDFIVACGRIEFMVHKAIITPASEYFKVVCRDDFKEKREGRIDLETSQPGIVARVLEFLYTAEYSIAVPPITQTPSSSTESASTLYDSLSDLGCKDPLEADLDQCIAVLKTHILVYQLADMLGISNLKHRAFEEFVSDYDVHAPDTRGFTDVLNLVFTSTPPTDNDLRRFVVERCIRQHEAIERDQCLEAILRRYEPMAWSTGIKLQTEYELLECVKAASDDTVAELQDKISRLTQEILVFKIREEVTRQIAA